jgi:hypothetical protein
VLTSARFARRVATRDAKLTACSAILAAAAILPAGCQKQDEHAPFAAGCESDCKPTPGITIGNNGMAAGGAGGAVATDGGFTAGALSGQVLALADDTFSQGTLFAQSATISADGASGTPVSASWNGVDPFALSGLAVSATNWVRVVPSNVQGDALPTIQAVQTNATDSADLFVVDSAAIDSVLTAVSAVRAPGLGQVVLFFRNAGTGAPLSGVQAVMKNNAAETPAYATTRGWVLQDDTTTTGAKGLVVFGNVSLPTGGSTTQTVTVSRPATATTAAVSGGEFSVQVAEGSVTLATVGLKL